MAVSLSSTSADTLITQLKKKNFTNTTGILYIYQLLITFFTASLLLLVLVLPIYTANYNILASRPAHTQKISSVLNRENADLFHLDFLLLLLKSKKTLEYLR